MKINYEPREIFENISQFIIINQIGIGSFGKVQMALHIDTNKLYAIKIIELNQEQFNEKEIMLLERQIYIHSNIDHPHIVKLWDIFLDQSNLYMVMELAQNSTLFNFQNKFKTFPEVQAFKYFFQTFKAIEYLHSLDIMHRDIKPQNILLDKNNNIKICDFGWATENIEMRRTTFCGTYEYMAPQMIFQKQYNYKIDIWAMGILLYELIHGFAPFQAKSLDEIKSKIKEGTYHINQNCSIELKGLIVDLLQFDPNDRPQTSQIKKYSWINRMKEEIKKNITKIKDQEQRPAERSAISKDKIQNNFTNFQSFNRKHKKLESFDKNINLVSSKHFNELKNTSKIVKKANQIQQGQNIKKLKKKCKTQGEESLEKIFTNHFQHNKINKANLYSTINFKKKQDMKENINLSKTHFSKWTNVIEGATSLNLGKNQPKSITRYKKTADPHSKRQKK